MTPANRIKPNPSLRFSFFIARQKRQKNKTSAAVCIKAGKENIWLVDKTTEINKKSRRAKSSKTNFPGKFSKFNSFFARPKMNRGSGSVKIRIWDRKFVPPSKNGRKKSRIQRIRINQFLLRKATLPFNLKLQSLSMLYSKYSSLQL